MDINITAFGREGLSESEILDLCQEALTSVDPPILPANLKEIDEVIQARLDSLEGAERFEAEKIYSHAQKIPPIKGVLISNLVERVAEKGVSEEAIRESFQEIDAALGEESAEIVRNEWGYITFPLVNSATQKSSPFSFDSLGATREGLKRVGLILSSMAVIGDRATRLEIASDLVLIAQMRLHFHFE